MTNIKSALEHKLFFPVFFGVIVLLFAAGGMYFFSQYNRVSTITSRNDPGELKKIVGSVSKFMDLPNEQPTLATVSDINKLQDQVFFKKAKNGDKVLIYPKAAIAILYRPTTNKIINVGPLTITPPTPSIVKDDITETTKKQPKITIALLNGTKISGLTRIVEADLRKKIKQEFTIASRGDAKNNAEKTIIVNVANIPQSIIQEFATPLKASPSNLPQEETKPEADILIIIGADYNSDITPQPTL